MMSGFLFPSFEATFRSPLNLEQARKALAANVNVKGVRNTFYWPTTKRHPFRGRLRDLTFVLAPDNGPTLVIVSGRLFDDDGQGTTIALKMRPASVFATFGFEPRAVKVMLKLREIFQA